MHGRVSRNDASNASDEARGATESSQAARYFRLILAIVAGLVGLHLVLGAGHLTLDDPRVSELYRLFHMGVEQSVPAHFSASLWMFGALLSYRLAQGATERGYWITLAVLCAFLSFDEALALHERLIEPVRSVTGASGVFHFAWTLVYGPLALLVGLTFSRFLWRLPRAIGAPMVIGGCLFVTGALGFELWESFLVDSTGNQRGLWIRISFTIEETLEMVGLATFLFGLMRANASMYRRQADRVRASTPVTSSSVASRFV